MCEPSEILQVVRKVDLDVQLRCYQSSETHLSSSWPKDQEIHVLINNYRIIINESESKMQKPLLLKKYCVSGLNMLQLNVRACCCSHLFELQLVHRPSITSVKNKISKERFIDSELSLNKIIEFMSPRQSEEDLHTISASTSLKCPITQRVIEIPIRGVMCRHIQCFDLVSFLHMNHERETWKCPICGELAVAVDANFVEVDGFISKIIQETQKMRTDSSEELTEILIDDKGNWSFTNSIKQEKPSPNKRCKQEPDTPSPESPKKFVKRRKLSSSKKKMERVETINTYNSQQQSAPNMMMPNRNDMPNLPAALLKDYPIKNLDNSPHMMSRTPLSGPSSVDSRGDKAVNSPLMMQLKTSPLSLPDSQLDLQPSIHLDPGFSTNLLEVLQNSEPTPTDDLPY
ncbi:Zinc finger MIZ domain-containing protein 1 [Oopsacas minuta]|uniref:Zinc finger MIZ domain-containing protein 1 n=1 Tax=Oopsacas minuta TaxID=111878 RepID=A0AAV7K5E1_9METZ|nr:Zinc finger MIZ domain-containing protein 1 [Oopsacas minuta]